jgi:hypothetical protein
MTPVEEHDIWLWLEFSAFEIKSIFRDSNPGDKIKVFGAQPVELPHRSYFHPTLRTQIFMTFFPTFFHFQARHFQVP